MWCVLWVDRDTGKIMRSYHFREGSAIREVAALAKFGIAAMYRYVSQERMRELHEYR